MKSPSIAIVTNGGWFNTFQRPHHFARYLRTEYQLEVMNNVVWLPFRGYGYMQEQAELVDGIRNLYLLKGQDRYRPIGFCNKLLLKLQNPLWYRSDSFRDTDVVYTWQLDDLSYLRHCDGKLVVYDAMDDWAAFGAAVDQRIIEHELQVVERADIVLTVSDKLQQRFGAIHPNTHLIRNGVDDAFFGTVPQYRRGSDDELRDLEGKPVAGYVGGLHDWVDVELLVQAAACCPEINFVVIGPASPGIEPLLGRQSNIRYLGPRPYSALPAYLAYFSVGLIPFKVNLLNESTNPIKLYEYLGAGLPVVSTGLPEVVALQQPGVVTIADTPQAFADQIRMTCSRANSIEQVTQRCRIAAQNSWASRTDHLRELITAARCSRRL